MPSHEIATATSFASSGRRVRRIVACHEILFALNFAFVFAYGFLFYTVRDLGYGTAPKSDLGYFFRRSAVRCADLLHFAVAPSVSTGGVARQDAGHSFSIAADCLVIVSVLAVALIFLSIVRLTAATSFYRASFNSTALINSLFGLPAIYLWVLKVSWPPGESHAFWQDVRPAILVGEALIFALLAAISKRRSLSMWASGSLVFAHGVLWALLLWPQHFVAFPMWELLVPKVLIFVFPSSAAICLLRQALRDSSNSPLPRGEAWGWTLAAFLAAAVLLILWWPAKAYALDRPGNLDSLQIEMSRGPCFGSCPTYSLTIHGSGKVEYAGLHHTGSKLTHEAVLSPEQVREVLQALDRAQFTALEDRAFLWCYDTASVSVTVSINRKTKRIVSDSYCDGMKFGVQDRFVQAAKQIDNIVGTSRWIER